MVAGSDASIFDRTDLVSRGVRVWLWGHQPFGVAAPALFEAMKAVQEGALPSELANKPSAQTMGLATDADGYDQLTQTYLK